MVAPARQLDIDPAHRTLAAVELGSNSFYLVVVSVGLSGTRVVDRIRERIRLEPALDSRGRVRGRTRDEALRCLERFGNRLRGLTSQRVRAVGTHALRQTRDPEFLEDARRALGHEIEVIDGVEEARLVNLAVRAGAARIGADRFVVDVGGGSTEVVHDRGGGSVRAASVRVGCVSGTERFFEGGVCSKRRFDAAFEWAKEAIREQAADLLGSAGAFDDAVGTAGTVNAIRKILDAEGATGRPIDASLLRRLRKRMAGAGNVRDFDIDGVSEERLAVLPGGIAVLLAAFDTFGLKQLRAMPIGLREGLIQDLVGREDSDACAVERAVQQLSRQFGIDAEQAGRVAESAESLRDSVAAQWRLQHSSAKALLASAARLHEIGLSVSHAGYHRHGEYLIRNTGVRGFSPAEQLCLAALVRYHRRKLSVPSFPVHPSLGSKTLLRLCCLLRLAVILNRDRAHSAPVQQLRVGSERIRLTLPTRERLPLIVDDLDSEARYLDAAGISLEVRWG